MTMIYSTFNMKVQSIDIGDNTGSAQATYYEIPQNISEMTISTLNAIGGNVSFVPYLPSYVFNMQNVGYPNFPQKMVPDVVLTGGITEFDRALETRGKTFDVSASTEPIDGAPEWFESDIIAAEFGDADKSSVARITLDFNLIDYQTLTGISKMQTINSIRVYKATKERELGFSLFGPAFGLQGSIKKVQGRHAAIRLLVQLNVIQIIGRFYDLPYWKLLPDTQPDPVVMETLRSDWADWNELNRIVKFQELLYIIGYDIPISGELDQFTMTALQDFGGKHGLTEIAINEENFLKLYVSLPVTKEAVRRREQYQEFFQQLLEKLRRQAAAKVRKPSPEEIRRAKLRESYQLFHKALRYGFLGKMFYYTSEFLTTLKGIYAAPVPDAT